MAFSALKEINTAIDCVDILIKLHLNKNSHLETSEIQKLKSFKGFGGIKEILYSSDPDDNIWKNKSLELKNQIFLFKNKLQEYAKYRSKPYELFIKEIKNSSLTAFFTPPIITNAIVSCLSKLQAPNTSSMILEPSCGNGAFIEAIKECYKPNKNIVNIYGIEKDTFTADIAAAIHKNTFIKDDFTFRTNILNRAFEKARLTKPEFSLIISNIPFGDIQVFDQDYFSMNNLEKEDKNILEFAQKSIHNYFAVKQIDLAEDNGIIAFITSGSFANNPANEIIRKKILRHAELITAVRFPDILFKEHANTEAPSDLLILRKFPNGIRNRVEYSEIEKEFIKTELKDNIKWNSFFLNNNDNIIYTNITPGTNQYGNPNFEVHYDKGIESIANDLKIILDRDINLYLNRENLSLKNETVINSNNAIINDDNNALDTNQLYDLYFKKAKSKVNKIGAKTASKVIKQATLNLFSTPQIENKFTEPTSTAKNIKVHSDTFDIQSDLFSTSEKSKNYNIHNFLYSVDEIGSLSSFKDKMLYFDENSNFFYLTRNHLDQKVYPNQIDINTLLKDTPSINIKTFDPNRLRAILNIRNSYNELFESEFSTQIEQHELRKKFNLLYDQFVKKYGILNKPINKKYASIDENFQFSITGIEIPIPNLDDVTVEYHKSTIFTKPINIINNEFIVNDEKSALIYSINNFGYVDIEQMSIKSGIDVVTLEDKLSDYILFDPGKKRYELKAIFLNSNLYQKLENFHKDVESNLSDIERIKYKNQLHNTEINIRNNIPALIPFDDIDISLGERWVPIDVYEKFVYNIFNVNTRIKYYNTTDEFKVIPDYKTFQMNKYTAMTKAGNKSAVNLLESALLNMTLTIKYKIDEVEYIDNDGTVVCNQIIQNLKEEFTLWLLKPENLDIRDNLTELYNKKFNGISIQKYDGSLLDLSDINWKNLGIPNAYESQKDTLMMLLCNQGGIVDHVPGGGKTLIECMTAHYLKKLGMINKPIILGLKANLNDLVATYKKAFPQDKIIAPTNSDFETKNRTKLFNQIKNNDWDCIFLTHNQFEKIPADPEIQRRIILDEIESIEDNLYELNKENDYQLSKRALKTLEKSKEKLEVKLESLNLKIEKRNDNLSHFGQLGIDHIIVDESHVFKNLMFSTRHNVAGLGNTIGSDRAYNMFCAIRTLQNKTGKDLQASFFSGTPISNSITELYLLFKYLTPNDLVDKNIYNFDSWAALFARKSTEFELSLTNELIIKERFREYSKVPELAKDYRKITDYRSAEDIGLKRPPIIEELITAKPTKNQMDIFLDMQEFIKSGHSKLFNFDSSEAKLKKSKGLIAADICTKTCLDIRFVFPDMDSEIGSKVHLLTEKVYQLYNDHNFKIDKATQLIFLDKGVPGGHSFNLYQDIKDRLIDKGIHENEIAFIHDYDNERSKPLLNQKMKQGSIRVLIGGTEKLGTGWNIQDRIIAMHNFDIPWKPSEIDQRKGRGQRAGNWVAQKNNGVYMYYYVTENSPEVAKVDRLRIKATFINQIKSGTITLRKIDEGTIDENSSLSYADIVMQTSGDSSYKEQSKLENLIAKLEIDKKNHESNAKKFLNKLNELNTIIIPNLKKNIQSLTLDHKDYIDNLKYNTNNEVINEIKLNGYRFNNEEEIGKTLIKLSKTNIDYKYIEIGSLYDFKITMNRNLLFLDNGDTQVCNSFQIHKNGNPITYAGGIISDEPKKAARFFYYALNRLETLIERETKALQNAEIEKNEIEKNDFSIVYPKQQELDKLKLDFHNISNKIKENIHKKNNTPNIN